MARKEPFFESLRCHKGDKSGILNACRLADLRTFLGEHTPYGWKRREYNEDFAEGLEERRVH